MALVDALSQALWGGRQPPRQMLIQNTQPSPLMAKALEEGARGDGNIETPLEGFGNLAQLLVARVNERRGQKSSADTYAKSRDALTYALTGQQPGGSGGGASSVAAAVGGTPSANGQQVYAPAPGTSPDVQQVVDNTARKYGIDEGAFRKLVQTESNFNPKAVSSTGAKGLTQFTNGTWRDYGNGADPFDPAANTDAAARLWLDNANGLRQGLGREPTAGEIYLAHQQGLGGALALLRNPDAPAGQVVNPKHVLVNGGNLNMTAREFANQWTGKFDNGAGIPSPSGFGARFDGTGDGTLAQPDFSRAGVDPNLFNPIPAAPAFGASQQPKATERPTPATPAPQQAIASPAPGAPATGGGASAPNGPAPDIASAPPGGVWDRTTNSWYVPPDAAPGQPARMDRDAALQVLLEARANQWNTADQNALYETAIQRLLAAPEYDYHFGTDGSVWRTSGATIEQLQAPRPPATFQPLITPEERAAYGIQPDDTKPYQVGPDNRVSTMAGGTSVNINNVGDNAWEKGINDYYVKQFAALNDAGSAALGEIGTLDRMKQLVTQDPGFYSGAWSDVALSYKQVLSAFGIDPSAARSMEEFQGLSYKAALDSMGGSLGTGFSNADRDFITAQQANLSATPEGNLALLETRRRIAERKVEIAQIANDYVQQYGKLDQGFFNTLRGYAETHPLFADLGGGGGSDGAGADGAPPQSYIDQGGDPELWPYLSPEDRALWQ